MDEPARTRVVAVLRGRVQNVGFRYTVTHIARQHAVAGTVRNFRSGEVEIDVERDRGAVDAFLDDVLAHPPPAGRVDAVGRSTAEPRGVMGFSAAETA